MSRRILLVTALVLSLVACQQKQQGFTDENLTVPPGPEEATTSSASSGVSEAAMAASSVSSVEFSPLMPPPGALNELQNMSKEPVMFAKGDLAVRIVKEESTGEAEAQYLVDHAKECHPELTKDSFKGFVDAFKVAKKITYSLQPADIALSGDTYQVTLIQNAPKYSEDRQFRDIFTRCSSGGPAPLLLTKDWLVLTTNCSANDGCAKVKASVEPTIKVR